MAAALAGIGKDVLIEGSAHMAPSCGLVHADIVDVKRQDVLKQLRVFRPLQDTEPVPQHAALPVGADEYRRPVIAQDGPELLFRILCRQVEQIGPSVIVRPVYLRQQFHDGRDIAFLCAPNRVIHNTSRSGSFPAGLI